MKCFAVLLLGFFLLTSNNHAEILCVLQMGIVQLEGKRLGQNRILSYKAPPNVNCTSLCGQHKKSPYVGNIKFKQSGAASAAPLQFYSGYAHSYRNECICQSDHLLPEKSSVYACRYTLFSEWRRNFQPLHCRMDFLSLTLTALSRKIELA